MMILVAVRWQILVETKLPIGGTPPSMFSILFSLTLLFGSSFLFCESLWLGCVGCVIRRMVQLGGLTGENVHGGFAEITFTFTKGC
ncbi:hypothetical protein V8C42DRAFT_325970 [Trichoderma barbatum]